MIRLRKGLDLPIRGAPDQKTRTSASSSTVAVLAQDYPGMRLSAKVRVGDAVRAGQAVLSDSSKPGICIPSPAAGSVTAIRRDGTRLLGVEIEVRGEAYVEFPRVGLGELQKWGRGAVTERLLEAGDRAALRERPFGRLAKPVTAPAAIFVRAMDSNPLAVDASPLLHERPEDLQFGLSALMRLTDGPVFVCSLPGAVDPASKVEGVEYVEFEGPHPAGLVGTHIHHLLPASQARAVWYTSYQDVLAIGQLLRLGRPDPLRVVSIAGPGIADPRIVRTTMGASTEALVSSSAIHAPCRVISGSVLSGRVVARPTAFLGRYHEQITVLPERPPASAADASRSRPWRRRRDQWTAELHGTPRPFFPLDVFERVVPLSVPIGPLLRALAAGDASSAIALGALELEEEDLALCSYHCPAKIDYGPLLRDVLDASAEARS